MEELLYFKNEQIITKVFKSIKRLNRYIHRHNINTFMYKGIWYLYVGKGANNAR